MPDSQDSHDQREQPIDAIIARYYRAEEAGKAPDHNEFIAQYPAFAKELKEFFADLGILGAAPPEPVVLGSTYITSIAIGVRQTGRYRLDRVLGQGAFGIVYLGYDEELKRQVAIKVPTKERFQKPEDAEAYLAEARTVASLDNAHDAHIVPVYDVGRTKDGSVYVVSKFIEGGTLEDRIKAGPLTDHESAKLLATVARALQHAHDRRLIHRDIKPANILLEQKSRAPWVADFGLAIREEDYLKQTAIAGTPSYMSPEQARGEGHRLDGRSDIFSMGVILYELLTGKKAFRGSSPRETVHLVISLELKPPREIRDTIPAELERICLKALTKLTSDRYATAAEFADDLEQWLKPTTVVTLVRPPVHVVPKGLRSFDAGDAEFFLDLLPGPRNRDGLPESIAFWKQRIEQTDPEQTFNVGLLYGPSGCGKSSLMKAGLLPHLSDRVIAVYVEATPEDTETRILRGLRKLLEAVPGSTKLDVGSRIRENSDESGHDRSRTTSATGLAETLAALRRSQGRKVVIIIDQFEQWLHAHRAEPDAELVRALRQCDGGRLQAILMLRDDFSMAASRFMRSLDIRIVEGHNFATVDLFDVSHAANVLTKFGQSFEKLPVNDGDLSADERKFVNDVSQGLTQDGKVVSVRLSLFAEMVRKKPWTAATLKQVGGTEGVGLNFLEETFSSLQANPDHRRNAVAARHVLRALLPELGTDIRGHMRSHAELLQASGYQDRPSDFRELLRILDSELRLITPTDPEGQLDGERQGVRHSSTSQHYFQLTHDYLVPSLREWLTSKQKETRRGRAELKLKERSALWNATHETRHLPSLLEWLGIRMLTKSQHWTEPQRTVMSKAGRLHGMWSGIVVAVAGILIAIGIGLRRQNEEGRNQVESNRLVEGLLTADTAEVSGTIDSLKVFRTWADPQLKQAFADSPEDSNAKLHAGLALVAEGQTIDSAVLEFLRDRLLTVKPGKFGSVREILEPYRSDLIPTYWELALDDDQPPERRFPAACALAAYDPTSSYADSRPQSTSHAPGEEPEGKSVGTGWNDANLTSFVAEQLIADSRMFVTEYRELFRPVAPNLVLALRDIFKDPARSELAKTVTISLLADYAANDPDILTELILVADPASDKSLFPVLQQHRAAAVQRFETLLDRRLKPDWKDVPLDSAWTEPSPADRAKIESAHGLITERFAFCQDMPWNIFVEITETLRRSGYRPTKVRPHLSLHLLTGGEGGRRPDEGVAVAVIWTRDGLKWDLQPSVTRVQLPAPDAPAAKNGMLLADLNAMPNSDPAAETQFVALWSEPPSPIEQCRVVIDVSGVEFEAAQAQLKEQGFASQSTISVRTDSAGQQRCTGISSNQGAPSELRLAYPGFELVHQPQWDVAVSPPAKLADPVEYHRERMAQIEKVPPEALDDPEFRLARAVSNYHLGGLDVALADLDFLIGKEIATDSVLRYRTLTLARLGKVEEANESLTRYLATDAPPPYKQYVKIQIPELLGEFEQVSAQLESAMTTSGQNLQELYYVAQAAALSSLGLSAKDSAQSKQMTDRSMSLLQLAVAQGYKNVQELKEDPHFASMHTDPRFVALLATMEPPAKYAALWRADIDFESKLLASVPIASVIEQLKPLLTQGWRPFAIAVDSSGGMKSAPTVVAGLLNAVNGRGVRRPQVGDRAGSGDPRSTGVPSSPEGGENGQGPDGAAATVATCSIVLHRPLIPDAAKEQLALQQSAAATALLRLNATDKVWPLFHSQPDPRLRSYLLHRLARYNIDPQSLITQLAAESDVSRRCSLILGVGEFAKAKLLTTEQQASVTADLAKRYADDLDSGVHGSAEWALKQLGAEDKIAEIRTAFSTGKVIGDRRWYLTKTGTGSDGSTGLTFAILDASEEFLMGSPVSAAERSSGPTGKDEIRHRRRIGRKFAMAVHEVTVAQFKAFRSNHEFQRQYAREDDAPANVITWYDAAAYCNWLSEQEGVPPEQWCFYPAQPFQDGMALPPDYLQRTGYRLPSEAEWEFACRAGTTTVRYFGETEALLGEYGWYTNRSGDKWMLQVGSLRPNGAGLFDMQGNVLEWCMDEPFWFDTVTERMGDKEQMGRLRNAGFRVVRGGSFSVSATSMRSADRNQCMPHHPNGNFGFRVARTIEPVPFTALPPSGGRSRIGIPQAVPQLLAQSEVLKFHPLIESGLSITSVQYSSDRSLVLFGGFDRFARLLDLTTHNVIQIFRGHENVVWSVALPPDGQTAVTGSQDKTLRLWDVASGKELDRFVADGIFSCVRYSKDGKSILATNWDGKVRVWKLSEKRLNSLSEFPFGFPTLDIALMPDETQFVVGTTLGQVLLCDAQTGNIQKTFVGHSGTVHSVAVVDSGRRILSAGHDSTLRLWDVETGNPAGINNRHTGIINEVRVLPGGQQFLSCGADRTVRLWDVASGRELARGIGSGELRGLSVAPDGKSFVTASMDGTLWVWELPESTQ